MNRRGREGWGMRGAVRCKGGQSPCEAVHGLNFKIVIAIDKQYSYLYYCIIINLPQGKAYTNGKACTRCQPQKVRNKQCYTTHKIASHLQPQGNTGRQKLQNLNTQKNWLPDIINTNKIVQRILMRLAVRMYKGTEFHQKTVLIGANLSEPHSRWKTVCASVMHTAIV